MKNGTGGSFRRTCVLPFEANPAELSGLRRTARSQLAAWGMVCHADEVELVVTELATNVIKHVGEGSAATLVLEPHANRLRVELHDKSHVVPTTKVAACDDECGRGLHLLATMAADWGTILTTTGKAVWCELHLTSDDNRRRIQRATTALDAYWRDSCRPVSMSGCSYLIQEVAAIDLISDLLHWIALHGSDPDTVLDHAQMHYEAEVKDT